MIGNNRWPVAGFRPFLALVLVAVLMMPTAKAETLYVTDILRLGLHQASDTSDTPFRMLASGDELEILERTRYYARVRTEDGQVGYVKIGYLTDEKPAQARLAELTAERDGLASEVERLQLQLNDQGAELESIRSARQQLEQQHRSATQELASLRGSNEQLTNKVSQYRYSVQMRWVLLTAVVMLALGLFAGWLWYDWKHRQKHGGFRL